MADPAQTNATAPVDPASAPASPPASVTPPAPALKTANLRMGYMRHVAYDTQHREAFMPLRRMAYDTQPAISAGDPGSPGDTD